MREYRDILLHIETLEKNLLSNDIQSAKFDVKMIKECIKYNIEKSKKQLEYDLQDVNKDLELFKELESEEI